MKYIFTLMLFVVGLYAHGKEGNHIHFFGALHVEDFVLLLVALIIGFSLFKYSNKERN